MNDRRVSRNDLCPCGSGRKFKKCCYHSQRKVTQLDRLMAIELIEQYVDQCAERVAARSLFFADLDVDVPTRTEHFRDVSNAAFLLWFAFDYPLDDGSYLVDRILKANPLLSTGERCYLEQMRTTAAWPYEVIAVRPGTSVVLRGLGMQQEIEVRERTASRMLKRWDLLVTRLNPLGPSGGWEMEMDTMHIPPVVQDEIAEIVEEELSGQSNEDISWRDRKELGVIFHQIWLDTIIHPRFPLAVTAEGDPVMLVTTQFDVLDEQRVRSALNAEPTLRDEGDTWTWFAEESCLGSIQLTGPHLQLETQSEPSAERGRQLIERIAQGAISYRSCHRVDLNEEAREAFRSGKVPQASRDEDVIPAEIQDQLFQEYMAKYNQQWLDELIPALDNQTPRVAAKSATLRPELIKLLKEMENHYLDALAAGKPAFDPTWMWDELELSDHQDAPRVRHPLWLAHESMEQYLPGIAQVVQSLAHPESSEGTESWRTAVTAADLQTESQVQELLRASAGRFSSGELLAHLECYCNYERQRRKTFWVDESLAWMLANTQVDAESKLFRLPFSSYVLVYTDRHTLSVAERALASQRNCPLRGQMLAVVCAYVVELGPDSSRIKVGLTFDAFAGQPPHLMNWELHIDPNATLEKTVADALAQAKTLSAGLFHPLLDAVVNATLYTTSAGVKIEQYRADQPPHRGEPKACLPSDAVYYLPGKIKISQMRKLWQVARGPSGRTLMHRFMVRGHWRRPNPNWTDQSLRWIEPYWRGPSLASIIEREYRVTP